MYKVVPLKLICFCKVCVKEYSKEEYTRAEESTSPPPPHPRVPKRTVMGVIKAVHKYTTLI